MMIEGRIIALICLLISFSLYYIYMELSRTGKKEISARSFPAIKAISEAVGRCAEMDSPLVFTTGGGGGSLRNSLYGPMTLAAIGILGYTARLCAAKGVKIKYFTAVADSLPLVEETIRTAYIQERVIENYDPDCIQFYPSGPSSMTAYLGLLQREKPASCMILGALFYPSIIYGEAGNAIGAMQIAGTANMYQIPFLIATCDYALIMDEIYAASAEITQNKEIIGTIAGEDVIKLIILGIIGIGYVLALGNIDFLVDLLGM